MDLAQYSLHTATVHKPIEPLDWSPSPFNAWSHPLPTPPPAPSAPRPASRSPLEEAIDRADIDMLKRALLTCIKQSAKAERLSTALFLDAPEEAGGRKRRRDASEEELVSCRQCDKIYDTTEEVEDELPCAHHPDELEIELESDAWNDWEEVHGPKDTEENRMAYPEGFYYTCCDKIGSAPPCTPCAHEAQPKKHARSALIGSSAVAPYFALPRRPTSPTSPVFSGFGGARALPSSLRAYIKP